MDTTISIKITDPVYKAGKTVSSFERFFLRFINDIRDMPFVRLCLVICLTTIPAAIYFFISDEFNWWLAILYFAYNSIFLMGPYILMLHNTSHSLFFKRKYNLLNKMVHWIIGPFFGETPESYYAHHLGMHHPENNLPDDLSCTMNYKRDSFIDFMKYFLRFFIFIVPDLSTYLKRKGRKKLLRNYITGESSWYVLVTVLKFLNWKAALVVFVIPLVFTRFMMMTGNWSQHAFIDLRTPGNCYRNSITCIYSAYNKTCFNDGYHIGHHLHPSMHWTNLPVNFSENISRYEEENAVVFRKLDYFMIWILLMTKSYGVLAKYYVDLTPGKSKTKNEIVDLLKNRTKKFISPKV